MFSLRWIRNENVSGKLNKGGKGRISLNIDGGVANIDIVETALVLCQDLVQVKMRFSSS